MSFLKLPCGDPLLTQLRDTFNANPIRVPEERIQPLLVLSVVGKRITVVGELKHLLAGGVMPNVDMQILTMADVSSSKTKSVETSIGLKILDGFLKGMGGGQASLKYAFKGVDKVSFSFNQVKRKFIDNGQLVRGLMKKRFDINNPFVKSFIEETAVCVIISSVITSSSFSMAVEEASDTNFAFDVPTVQKAIAASSKVNVKSKGKLEISFDGANALAFAFSGLQINIDAGGGVSHTNEPDDMALTTVPDDADNPPLPPAYLADENELVDFS